MKTKKINNGETTKNVVEEIKQIFGNLEISFDMEKAEKLLKNERSLISAASLLGTNIIVKAPWWQRISLNIF